MSARMLQYWSPSTSLLQVRNNSVRSNNMLLLPVKNRVEKEESALPTWCNEGEGWECIFLHPQNRKRNTAQLKVESGEASALISATSDLELLKCGNVCILLCPCCVPMGGKHCLTIRGMSCSQRNHCRSPSRSSTWSPSLSAQHTASWPGPRRPELIIAWHVIVWYMTVPSRFLTVLYYTILYYTILYYTILYYTILYYTILYYTILYYTILCYTILYYTMLYYTILYYTILYYTILCYAILYYTILYYTILYYTILY